MNQQIIKHHWRIAIFCSLATALCISLVCAQTQTTGQTGLLDDKSQAKANVQSAFMAGPALEGPVDAAKYIVGPSDVFAVNIWALTPVNLLLTVTPEGTLIVPTVGEIRVSGLPLAEARKSVLSAIGKKYLSGQPTVTLVYPRQLVVKVTGDVVTAGRYVLSATDRVDNAIQAANKPFGADETRFRVELEKVQKSASTRNIRLTHRDGRSVRVDIPKFYASRDADSNPFLLDGDEIFVPRRDGERNVIGVYGAVNSPSRFEYADGDNLLDAVELAHGLTVRAIRDSVTLTRYAADGISLLDSFVNYDDIKNGKAPSILLQPGDRIVVREKFDPRGDYQVTVQGEVAYPGTYPITRDRTKLSEVIARSGGFTEYAALRAAHIRRTTITPEDLEKERIISARGAVILEDTAYLSLESRLRLMLDVVDADFEALFLKHDSTQDVILRSQDTIIVPSLRNTVYVFGQVTEPGGVPFVPGKDLDYYVDKVKGYTDYAKTGDVVVIKRKSRQWFPPTDTKIEEGDFIWVPKKIHRDFTYWLAIIGQSASIFSVAISTVLLVIQLSK